jgi:hypothetical protein
VVIEGRSSMLVDRPLLEAKEAVGGYAILEAADLDAALAIARSFPVPDGKIEVRPVVERGEHRPDPLAARACRSRGGGPADSQPGPPPR